MTTAIRDQQTWVAGMSRNVHRAEPISPDRTSREITCISHTVPASDDESDPRMTLGSATTVGLGFTIAWQDTLHGENGATRRGATTEEVLAACHQRLYDFQTLTSFASEENSEAMRYIQKAIETLHRRTLDRMRRKVEGKHEA